MNNSLQRNPMMLFVLCFRHLLYYMFFLVTKSVTNPTFILWSKVIFHSHIRDYEKKFQEYEELNIICYVTLDVMNKRNRPIVCWNDPTFS